MSSGTPTAEPAYIYSRENEAEARQAKVLTADEARRTAGARRGTDRRITAVNRPITLRLPSRTLILPSAVAVPELVREQLPP
jgi:hypothetical protein